MSNAFSAILAGVSLVALPFSVAAAQSDPLAAYIWRNRVVVALAPSGSDAGLREQRRLFAAMASGARDRDLVLIVALDGTPQGAALRRRFGGGGFRAVLVGKDGGAKVKADHPLGPDALFPLIDAMPMRQEEMRRTP